MERSMFSLDFFRLASAMGGWFDGRRKNREEEGKKTLFSSPLF